MANKPVLYDAFGRAMRRADLKQELMAPTSGGVRSPLTGTPADGLTPARLTAILQGAAQGDGVAYLELAEFMEERDPHYHGILRTRRQAVSQLEITVEPAGDGAAEVAHAKYVQDWVNRDTLQGEIFNILDAIPKGYSLTEIIWDTSAGQFWPQRLETRDARWIRFDRSDLATPLRLDDDGKEVPLEGGKFIFADMLGAKTGLPLRAGVARVCLWPYLFKKFTERDWAIFSQTYGHPVRVGKYHPSATEDQRDKLFRAVANIAGDMAATIPESMQIEFVEPGNLTATGQLYKDRVEYLDKQMSKAVLGQTSTTDAETGGLGSGKEHREVQEDIEKADAVALAAILNRDLVRPMIQFEFGPQRRYPTLKIGRPEAEDTEKFVANVTQLVDRGFKISQKDVHDRIGTKPPEKGAEILQIGAKAAPESEPEDPASISQPQNAPSKPLQALQRQTTGNEGQGPSAGRSAPPDMVADLANSATKEFRPAMAAIVEAIEVMVEQAGSFHELREMIATAYPEISNEELAEALSESLAAGHAAGQIGVASGDG